MKRILKYIASALAAWWAGLLVIGAILYFSNNGSDFTVTDIMGFGVMAVVASGILMLVIYLPALHLLKKRLLPQPHLRSALLTGVLCNLPIFIVLTFLAGRKMSLNEAVGFMTTFLIIGLVFGFGVAPTSVQNPSK